MGTVTRGGTFFFCFLSFILEENAQFAVPFSVLVWKLCRGRERFVAVDIGGGDGFLCGGS